MTKRLRAVLVISLIINAFFIVNGIWDLFSHKLGVLTQDIQVGHFANGDVIYTLPKGLSVRDASPQGVGAIGQFEPNRFFIVITTDQEDVVNYSVKKDSLYPFDNLYSMDFRQHEGSK